MSKNQVQITSFFRKSDIGLPDSKITKIVPN